MTNLISVTTYKINSQKEITFVYDNNELIEEEIVKIIPFTTTSRKIKCFFPNIFKDKKKN